MRHPELDDYSPSTRRRRIVALAEQSALSLVAEQPIVHARVASPAHQVLVHRLVVLDHKKMGLVSSLRAIAHGPLVSAILRPVYAGRGTILVLHHIVPREEFSTLQNQNLELAPEDLDALIRWACSKRYKLTSLGQFCANVRARQGRKMLCLTFDDGYVDTLTHALPVLERHSAPATIFVITNMPDLPRSQLFLTWDNIRKLAQHPLITIGAHTVSHPVLSSLSDAQLETELLESKRRLETETQREVTLFAYPFGIAGPRECEAAKQAGFEAAVTSLSGNVVDGHKDHLWALPRHWVGNPRFSVSELESRMSGYDFFRRGQFRPMVTHRGIV